MRSSLWLAVLLAARSFAAAGTEDPLAGAAVCVPGGRGYELRLVALTPAAPFSAEADVAVALNGPWLDQAGLSALAARFGGTSPTGLPWGFLVAAPPGAPLTVEGHVPGRENERFAIRVDATRDPARHTLVVERFSLAKPRRLLSVELADGESRAFVIADGRKRRVVATLVAGPCAADGLTGVAAGPCEANSRAGFVPARAAGSGPGGEEKARPARAKFPGRIVGSSRVRYVIARDGRVVDPLVVLDGPNDETLGAVSIAGLAAQRFEPATVEGQAVASCSVIVLTKSVISREFISSYPIPVN